MGFEIPQKVPPIVPLFPASLSFFLPFLMFSLFCTTGTFLHMYLFRTLEGITKLLWLLYNFTYAIKYWLIHSAQDVQFVDRLLWGSCTSYLPEMLVCEASKSYWQHVLVWWYLLVDSEIALLQCILGNIYKTSTGSLFYLALVENGKD